MKTHQGIRRLLAVAVSLGLIGLMAGCSTDSPSEPAQNPPPPGGGTPGATPFTITVTASPVSLALGTTDPSTVTVDVRRTDNGQFPANGTTLVLSTSLGELGSLGSGVRSLALQLINGRAQTQFFAGTSQGTAVLSARLENSIGQATVAIQAAATFFVSFVSPNSGSPLGGETVSVQGGGFEEPVRVTFAGIAAQILSVESGRIRCIVPASTVQVPVGSTRPINVEVTVNLNETTEASDSLTSGYVYTPGGTVNQPQVLSVSPTTGTNSGGTRVTIAGIGFQSPVQVLFGLGDTPSAFTGVEATVESVSPTQIVVRSPAATGFGQANQNQQVAIVVRNLDTGFVTLFASAFRYGAGIVITSVSPDQIGFDSQETVTIFGQGFQAPVTVNLAGIQAAVLSVNGSEIRVRAPIPAIADCEDVLGPIQVINVNSGASDTTSGGDGPNIADFRYRVVAPTVTGVSPSSFVGSGGNTVTVSGVGFDDPVRVVFGTAAGSVIGVNGSGTQITVTTPTATFTEVACNDNGDGQQGSRFQPLTVNVTEVNLLTQCDSTLVGGYTYIPADQTCRGDVEPTPPPIPQCSDTFDNDSDGFTDALDPQCTGPTDNSEST